MKDYYECHITMLGEPYKIQSAVRNAGWKFSVIDGDPDLGDGLKCYATKHFNKKYSAEFIVDVLQEATKEIIEASGATLLRKKIEVVIYDERIR